MAQLVLREDRGGLATLTLNRPDKLNALSLELMMELRDHLETIGAQTGQIGLVAIRGAGKGFSAGNDMEEMRQRQRQPGINFKGKTVDLIAQLPQPVIAAVHGVCYTGALEMALAADMIVAAESARFADTHAKWGLIPMWGMSQRLPRRIGAAKATEMMITSRPYSAAEALAMGLINLCFPDADFDREMDKLTSTIVPTHGIRCAATSVCCERPNRCCWRRGWRTSSIVRRARPRTCASACPASAPKSRPYPLSRDGKGERAGRSMRPDAPSPGAARCPLPGQGEGNC